MAEKKGMPSADARPPTAEGEIVIYRTEDGKVALDVRLAEGTVWLSQADMVKLFGKTKQNISLHIRNISNEGELREGSVVKENLTTAADGKSYRMTKEEHCGTSFGIIKGKRRAAFQPLRAAVRRHSLLGDFSHPSCSSAGSRPLSG